jgi:hypothetical protein
MKLIFYGTMLLALAVCGLQIQNLDAQEQEIALPSAQPLLTTQQASALEDQVRTNPEDLQARDRLMMYYFQAMITSRSSELENKREQHIFWLVEHHPDSRFAGSPEAMIIPFGFSSTDGYQHGKELWLKQIESHSDNLRVLLNGAHFVALSDGKLGQSWLEKALALDPGNFEAASMLAASYRQERLLAPSPEAKTTLAKKALSVQELALSKAVGEDRFNELTEIAPEALDAGQIDQAEQYASELLQTADQFKGSWNYGNALQKGHIVLGRAALRRGNVPTAKDHLLAAGAVAGSPQLDSFGPDMTLAKELLDKGERDTVVAYLQACSKFWKMGAGRLQEWIATIKSGGTPDFGANLLY